MFRLRIFIFFIFLVLCSSCSKEQINESTIKGKSLDHQVLKAYEEGIEALEGGDVMYAAKKFNEAEIVISTGKMGIQISFNGRILLLYSGLLW